MNPLIAVHRPWMLPTVEQMEKRAEADHWNRPVLRLVPTQEEGLRRFWEQTARTIGVDMAREASRTGVAVCEAKEDGSYEIIELRNFLAPAEDRHNNLSIVDPRPQDPEC